MEVVGEGVEVDVVEGALSLYEFWWHRVVGVVVK